MNGSTENHVITIDHQELESMKEKLKDLPKLLNKSAGKSSCCIFRVPQSLVEINKEAYQPRIVSIGPYHHGSRHLEMIQEHKWRFLNDFLARSGRTKNLEFFLKLVLAMDSEIRQCYSESIDHFNENQLAKMMVLDGFFIIELFRKAGGVSRFDADDPILTMSWMSPFLMRDLLRLENQIPFFVLQKLFNESRDASTNSTTSPDSSSFAMLTLKFFNYSVDRPKRVLENYRNLEGKHLLDFFGKSFISNHPTEEKPVAIHDNPSLKHIHPATKLQVAGVKFKANPDANSFLDIKFKNGFLEIPQIKMDDFYSSFFLNCVSFEQCYSYCSKDFTTYVVFMSWLINTPSDAGLLSENKIIENYFGTDKELARFFHNVGKDAAFDIKNNYLMKLFMEVNDYYTNGWHVGWAGFKHTYFDSPWSFISAFAAFLLLSLTVIQAFYTVYQYYRPPQKGS